MSMEWKWIKNEGIQPVDDNVWVDVKDHNGKVSTVQAGDFDWKARATDDPFFPSAWRLHGK